jgi:periplasmic divalent cation tolerance protein
VLVSCSAGTPENAEQIALALVEARLAACVQIAPIASYYRWKGAVRNDREQLLLIKTSAARAAEVEALIKRLHPYELPEITVVEIAGGSAEYLGWIAESTAL